MIEFLKLHRLGIIDDAHIELGPGLTVITGETGAGKTMVPSALRLLLGGKSDQGLAASKETSVQGGWLIDPTGPVATQLAQAGVELLDGEFLLTRTMPSEGRSRCSRPARKTSLPFMDSPTRLCCGARQSSATFLIGLAARRLHPHATPTSPHMPR